MKAPVSQTPPRHPTSRTTFCSEVPVMSHTGFSPSTPRTVLILLQLPFDAAEVGMSFTRDGPVRSGSCTPS